MLRRCVIQFLGLQQGLKSCSIILGKYMKMKAEWPEFKIFSDDEGQDIPRLLQGIIFSIFSDSSSFSAINLQDFASS